MQSEVKSEQVQAKEAQVAHAAQDVRLLDILIVFAKRKRFAACFSWKEMARRQIEVYERYCTA